MTEVVDGRALSPVNVGYMRDFRSDIDALKRVLVSTPGGQQGPLGQLAAVHARRGPSMMRDEDGVLAGYIRAGSIFGTISGEPTVPTF